MKKKLECIICILLIGLLFFVLYLKFIKKAENINLFGYSFFIVKTGSMEPNIKIGELIIVKEKSDYDIGKIVTYYDEDAFITHRIINKKDNIYFIKGDNNNVFDEKVLKENIIGEVIFHSLFWGIFITKYLKILLLVYILFIIFGNFYGTKEKEIDEEK